MEVTVLRTTRSTMQPHPSVTQYIETGSFDIKADILTGLVKLPPPPPMRKYTKATAPPIPSSVQGALATDEAIWWLHAIVKEVNGHFAPPDRPATYELTDQWHDTPPRRSVWTFRRKFEGTQNDGEHDIVSSYKAREALDGSTEVAGVDFAESYIGLAPVSDIRRMDNLALQLNWLTFDADFTQAYCQHGKAPRPEGGPTTMMPAPGVRIYDKSTHKPQARVLRQELYGGHSAGTTHYNKVADSLLNKNHAGVEPLCPLPIERNPYQPTFFALKAPSDHEFAGEHLIVYLHNDNIRSWASNVEVYRRLWAWLRTRWTITGDDKPLQSLAQHKVLSTTVKYTESTVEYTLTGYIMSMLNTFHMPETAKPVATPMIAGFSLSKLDEPTTEAEKREIRGKAALLFKRALTNWTECRNLYAEIVSSIGWVVRQVAPVLALPHSMLGRAMAAPSLKAFKAARRVLQYLHTRTDISLTYVKQREFDWRNGDWPQYMVAPDASFADDEAERKSQGGRIGYYRGCAPDEYSSSKSHRVCYSTFMAEALFASQAAKQAEYVKHMDDWPGVTTGGPIPLAIDNQATILSAAAPIRKWSPKSKAFDIDCKYVTEAREAGTIDVYHVSGDNFPADAMTKALPDSVLGGYYDRLQGPSKGRGQTTEHSPAVRK